MPSGKIKEGETPLDALWREIQEELRGWITPMNSTAEYVGQRLEERASKSYPGLRCVYEVHTFHIVLELPDPPDELRIDENGTILIFKWA